MVVPLDLFGENGNGRLGGLDMIPGNEFTTKSDRCLDHDKWV
jgi:hypothetical protein